MEWTGSQYGCVVDFCDELLDTIKLQFISNFNSYKLKKTT
jgi:hypothetical protein